MDTPAVRWPGLLVSLRQLLTGADEATLQGVLGLARFVRFRRGDPLMRQGDGLAILIVLNGYVSAQRQSPEGRQFMTLLLRPGHVVGLGSVVRRVASRDELVGLSDGVAATLSGTGMRRFAARDAGLALRLFDLGAGLLEVMAERLDQATFDSAERRVATILLSYEDLVRDGAPLLSRTALASLAGTSREMLGVVIRNLEAAGAVHRHGRAIIIDNRPLLNEIAAWESCGADHARALTIPCSTRLQQSADRASSTAS